MISHSLTNSSQEYNVRKRTNTNRNTQKQEQIEQKTKGLIVNASKRG